MEDLSDHLRLQLMIKLSSLCGERMDSLYPCSIQDADLSLNSAQSLALPLSLSASDRSGPTSVSGLKLVNEQEWDFLP